MRTVNCALGLIGWFLLPFLSHAATITGTIKGADNAPIKGAFVEARNIKTRMTVAVLSSAQGHYRIGDLPSGSYQLSIKAGGFEANPRNLDLTADQNAPADFVLQKGTVAWSDISIYQGRELFPTGEGKDEFFQNCTGCHAFQNKMGSVTHSEEDWQREVEQMRATMHYALPNINDRDVAEISFYLTRLFGPTTELAKSPADEIAHDMFMGYKSTVQPFSDESLNVVYVEYDVPPPGRFPRSATLDEKTGFVWIANGGASNKISRLDPKTGDLLDFAVPNAGTAAIHSILPLADGSVWFTEEGTNKLGRWDPVTKKITEYDDPKKEGLPGGTGSKYTLRIGPAGDIWTSGEPLTKFDPRKKEFTHFEQVPLASDAKIDANGNIWFVEPRAGKIGRVDGKTMEISRWDLPTPDANQGTIEIAPDGMIWATEFESGKLARFDPRTQTFQEYPLPGPDPSPATLSFDRDGYLWYSSQNTDVMARLDTHSGKVIEYRFPHSEITVSEFSCDAQGRMWYASRANNKVGYFFLAKTTGVAQ